MKEIVLVTFLFIYNFSYAQKLHRKYYKNGQLKAIGKYQNWKKGVSKTFSFSSDDGFESIDGERTDEWKFYHENGQLESIGKYQNNKKTDKWKLYHKNGQLESIGKYENGEKIGEWKFYRENGKLSNIQKYKNRKLVELKEYYENNQLEEVIEYNKNGEFSSIREYYKNGQLKHEINYDENGEISGEWKIYYDNGQLMVIAKYHNDKFIDIISYFDNKGNKLYKGTIKNGNGTVNHYDETGRLIKIITYINGEIKE